MPYSSTEIVYLLIGVKRSQTCWAGFKKPTGRISSSQIEDGGQAQTGTKREDAVGGAGWMCCFLEA